MPVGDKYRVAVTGLIQGQEWVNVLHFNQISADGINTGTDGVALAVQTAIIPTYANVQNPLCVLSWIDVTRIGPGTPSSTERYTINQVGTRTGTMLPSEVSAVVQKKSFIGLRSGRGRMYVCGLNIADIVQATGYWTTGTIGDLNDLGIAINSPAVGIDTATFQPGIVDRAGVFTATTRTAINTVPRSQRRRQIGRGI